MKWIGGAETIAVALGHYMQLGNHFYTSFQQKIMQTSLAVPVEVIEITFLLRMWL